MKITGIVASEGRALSQAFVLHEIPCFDQNARATLPQDESQRLFAAAVESVANGLKAAAARMRGQNDDVKAQIIEIQLIMLEDPYFAQEIRALIAQGYAPEAAVLRAGEAQQQALQSLDDPYLAARSEDIRDLSVRLACQITGRQYPDISSLTGDAIVVAADLLPSMLMTADLEHVKGIVTAGGSKTSHVAILASAKEIPAIVGCKGASEIREGEWGYLDAQEGCVHSCLTDEERGRFAAEVDEYRRRREQLAPYANRETRTADGKRLYVYANIVEPSVLEKASGYGVDGVGLFRTEFLFMNRAKLPDEQEQFAVYKSAAMKLSGKPLTIRTLDIGGDKQVKALDLPGEENPFLGYRGIRIGIDRPDLLLTQLRAILRASAFGTVLVMFPMVAASREIDAALALLEQAKAQLREKGASFDETIRTGIMIEVPSAAVLADKLIRKVDFFSIGSNDLTQYTLAADRLNTKVAHLYHSLDPAVLKLIKNAIDAAASANKECSLCGEMASDPLACALLAGLGLTKFSVSPAKALQTKRLLCSVDLPKLFRIAQTALDADDALEVESLLREGIPSASGAPYHKEVLR